MAGSGAEWVRRCNLGRLSGLNVVLKGVTRKPLCVTACKCLCLSSGGGVLPPLLHHCTAGAIQTLVLPLAINGEQRVLLYFPHLGMLMRYPFPE